MNTDQFDMFGNGKSSDEAQLERAIEVVQCAEYRVVKSAEDIKELAIEAGYKVTDPIVINSRIVNLVDLRNYFFKRLGDRYPEKHLYYVDNRQNELRLIRLFVEAREKTGLNRFHAIQECISIIDTVFDHEKEFNFKRPIDIRLLGQAKAGWVTQKAICILTRKQEEKESEKFKKLVDEIESEGVNLQEKSNELGRLLSKMEVNNG